MRYRISIALATAAIVVSGCSGGGQRTLPQPAAAPAGQARHVRSTSQTLLSGTVIQINSPTSFVYETNYPHGNVPVTDSGATITGGTVAVNQVVTATGSFSGSTFVATAVTIEPTAPRHVETWAYDTYNASTGLGQGNVSGATVAQYATYAEGGISASTTPKVLSDCHTNTPHCTAVEYSDPNTLYVNPPSGCSAGGVDQSAYNAALADTGNTESWFIHQSGYTDSAHRVQGGYQPASSCPKANYELNQSFADVQNWYAQVYTGQGPGTTLNPVGDQYDAYLTDNTAATVKDQAYFYSGGGCAPFTYDATTSYIASGTLCSTTQEMPADASVVSAHDAFWNASVMKHQNGTPLKFFFNSLSFDGTVLHGANLFGSSGNLLGGFCEGCVVDGTAKDSHIAPTLDAALAARKASNAFVLLSDGTTAQENQYQDLRLLALGIDWLAYAPGTMVGFENLEDDTSGLGVWPEQMLYPSEPLAGMSTGNADLNVPGFTTMWMREFATCYNAGAYIGRCAVVVNGTGAAQTLQGSWFAQTYRYYMTLSAGDAASGAATTRTNQLTYGTTQVRDGSAIFLFN
jgi:hypothetical protein